MIDAILIRRLLPDDLPQVAAIMNDSILNGTGSLDSAPKTVEMMAARFDLDRARFPVLVAILDDKLVAWASVGLYSDRCAYGDTGEVSIYVAPEAKGRGVGSTLLRALVAAAWEGGLYGLIARIAEGNPASLALHRACGFVDRGFLPEIGQKFGRRLGIHLLQLLAPR